MSITKEKATRVLECMAIDMVGAIAGMRETDPMLDVLQQRIEAVDLAQSALRPVSREHVEKVMRGVWEMDKKLSAQLSEKVYLCSRCKNFEAWGESEKTNFCGRCGAPMTDEAMEMVLERLGEIGGAQWKPINM